MKEWFAYPQNMTTSPSENASATIIVDMVNENQIQDGKDENVQNETVQQYEKNEPRDLVVEENENVAVVMTLRKSSRQRKSAISDDYHIYYNEIEFDLGEESDPISIKEAMQSQNRE